MLPRSSPAASVDDDRAASARVVFDYLAAADASAPDDCDAVVGFGVFDLRVAALCGALHLAGRARRVIFTGGIGAGTADLGRPEADAFADELARLYPEIPRSAVIVENRSTNTGDNIRFTLALLARDHPGLSPGAGLRRAVLVASPARLRRVRLTWRRQAPLVAVWSFAPASTFEHERDLHAGKGIDYLALLAGEVDRLRDYPARGWIVPERIPSEILAARDRI